MMASTLLSRGALAAPAMTSAFDHASPANSQLRANDFDMTINLPAAVDPHTTRAVLSLADGSLQVTIPELQQRAQADIHPKNGPSTPQGPAEGTQ
eukprot:scaffold39176_cov41-Prasinocladus_malaysianus.AAC.1